MDYILRMVEHWNENRVPILRISTPDKAYNFQGAMRFYFQDSGQKVATKCVTVKSTDTTNDVINILIEKFRPDMRMLSAPQYGLYEIHENGDERMLTPDEKPIFAQLDWNRDDREGRFLLRRMDEKTLELGPQIEEPSLKRKLTKKEKKKQEKAQKQQLKKNDKEQAAKAKKAAKNGIAERLYNELPETSFTRSISNPEAVMKRRRAQKLERRLQEFSMEGGQDAGGTLRIFGETINKDVSYKTLLLSNKDTAAHVVKQILEKYGKEEEDPSNYCLVQLIVPTSATGSDNNSVQELNTSSSLKEYILDEDDCPLLINQKHDKSQGILTFHIRQKPSNYQPRKRKKKTKLQQQQNPFHNLVVQQLNMRQQLNNGNNHCSQNSPAGSQNSGSMSHEVSQSIDSSVSQPTLPSVMNPIMSNGSSYQGATMNYQPDANLHQNFIMNQPLHLMQGQQMNVPQFVPNPPRANEQILPALIQVKEDVEDFFLDQVITSIKPADTAFKLIPTYVLYMVSRYRASTLFHQEMKATDRAKLFEPFTEKIACLIKKTVEFRSKEPLHLAFWLANASDLCHFYKQDKHLSRYTLEAQDLLVDSVIISFRNLLICKQQEFNIILNSLFEDPEGVESDQLPSRSGPTNTPTKILNLLIDTMTMMRKCRVNANLTIQVFAHLFHYINKWLFDRLIGVYDKQTNFSMFCNRPWGIRLSNKLDSIGAWAETQGLELVSERHLTKVKQLTMFLSSSKANPQEISAACDACNQLNLIQLKNLLERYNPSPGEVPLTRESIDNLLFLAQNNMDRIFSHDMKLEEDMELNVPFLIPENDYSSKYIRYIPKGLLDFVSYLSKLRVKDQELCIFTVQPTSSGYWTVYFSQPEIQPEIMVIQLTKINNSMGLSIIAAKGRKQTRQGIYIKSVVKNGAAAKDGRLQAGDQLLEVDDNSLIDISQDRAAGIIQRTKDTVTLKVAKHAAIHYDLPEIINAAAPQTINAPVVVQQIQPPVLLNNTATAPQYRLPRGVSENFLGDQHKNQQQQYLRDYQNINLYQNTQQVPFNDISSNNHMPNQYKFQPQVPFYSADSQRSAPNLNFFQQPQHPPQHHQHFTTQTLPTQNPRPNQSSIPPQQPMRNINGPQSHDSYNNNVNTVNYSQQLEEQGNKLRDLQLHPSESPAAFDISTNGSSYNTHASRREREERLRQLERDRERVQRELANANQAEMSILMAVHERQPSNMSTHVNFPTNGSTNNINSSMMTPSTLSNSNSNSSGIVSTNMSNNSSSVISPLKSPKKVSWVDNQPQATRESQSLHTLHTIPSSPASVADTSDQSDDTVIMVNSNSMTRDEVFEDDDDDERDDDDEDEEEIDDDISSQNTSINNNTIIMNPNSHLNGNGQPPKTPQGKFELSDIDEALSLNPELNSDWNSSSDGPGVIGKQEVYNDPRLKIVQEKELVKKNTQDCIRPEKLNFQEKLKLFKAEAEAQGTSTQRERRLP